MSQQVMGFMQPRTCPENWLTWIWWVEDEVESFDVVYDLPRALQMMRGFCLLTEEPDEDGYMC